MRPDEMFQRKYAPAEGMNPIHRMPSQSNPSRCSHAPFPRAMSMAITGIMMIPEMPAWTAVAVMGGVVMRGDNIE